MDLSSQVAGIKNRTLVMCGALDQTTPPALAQQLAKNIANGRYEGIPDSGHCPMLEQGGLLAEKLVSFSQTD